VAETNEEYNLKIIQERLSVSVPYDEFRSHLRRQTYSSNGRAVPADMDERVADCISQLAEIYKLSMRIVYGAIYHVATRIDGRNLTSDDETGCRYAIITSQRQRIGRYILPGTPKCLLQDMAICPYAREQRGDICIYFQLKEAQKERS
jgi:hypothetical protein